LIETQVLASDRCRQSYVKVSIANRKQSGESAAYSFVLRGHVRHWLGNVWAEYDRIRLTEIVGAQAEPDIRARARG
jgi:hypothetical protein